MKKMRMKTEKQMNEKISQVRYFSHFKEGKKYLREVMKLAIR